MKLRSHPFPCVLNPQCMLWLCGLCLFWTHAAFGGDSELPCELALPPGIIAPTDYFDHVGSLVEVDDDCGFFHDLPVGGSAEGWVLLDTGLFPHELSISARFDLGSLTLPLSAGVKVLELSRDGGSPARTAAKARGPAPEPSAELWVVALEDGRELRLTVIDDTGSPQTHKDRLPNGDVALTLELRRSTDGSTHDGMARVLVNGLPSLDAGSLLLWETLPTGARFGVIETDDPATSGTVYYRPIAVSRMFPPSPVIDPGFER